MLSSAKRPASLSWSGRWLRSAWRLPLPEPTEDQGAAQVMPQQALSVRPPWFLPILVSHLPFSSSSYSSTSHEALTGTDSP